MNKKLFSIFTHFIFLIAAFNIFAQTTIKPTVEEQKEVQIFVKEFHRRLDKTFDITPLLNDFFVPNAVTNIKIESEFTSPKIQSKITFQDRIKTYTTFFNLYYFISLAVLNDLNPTFLKSSQDDKHNAYKSILPAKIGKALTQAGAFFNEYGDEKKFESLIQFRRNLDTLKNTLTISGKYLKKHSNEKLKTYQKGVVGLNDISAYRIQVWTAEQVKNNFYDTELPSNTRLLRVETPLLTFMLLIRYKGQLKILSMLVYDGD